jgi:hypothetical protein
LKGNTVTIKETDQTASPSEREPPTQSEPDILVYRLPQDDPAAAAEADSRAESYDRSDFQTRPDETDTSDEAEAEDSTAVGDAEIEAPVDGPPESNGDGQDETEQGSEADSEVDTEIDDEVAAEVEVQETAATVDQVIEERPLLTDRGVVDERWRAIQVSFVDDPRHAVESADLMVAEAMEDLGRVLISHRESLEAQWRQDDVDTEQLRLVFRRYREFHVGLLNT